MKTKKPIKRKICKLIKELGSHRAVAEKLGINLSYVYYMQHGKEPGRRLYRDICQVYDNIYNNKEVIK